MTADELEQRLRDTLARTADRVPETPRPVLTWEEPRVGVRPAGRPRVRTVLQFAVPVAVAAAVAGIVVLPDSGDGGQPGPATTSEAPSPPLQEAALIAPGSTVPLEPGQYLYSRITRDLDKATVVFETWRPQHAADPWTQRYTDYDPVTGELVRPPQVTTAPCGQFDVPQEALTGCDDAGSWSNPTPQFLASLPSDPAELYRQIAAQGLAEYRSAYDRLPADQAALMRATEDSEQVIAQRTMVTAMHLAQASGGMSQPFSRELEQAIALMPGAVAGDEKNLAGEGSVSYRAETATGEPLTVTMVFDVDGNYLGDPWTEFVVGAADAAGVAPPAD